MRIGARGSARAAAPARPPDWNRFGAWRRAARSAGRTHHPDGRGNPSRSRRTLADQAGQGHRLAHPRKERTAPGRWRAVSRRLVRVTALLATLLTAAVGIVAAPALAAEDRHLLYEARFLGLPVGDVAVRLNATETHYRIAVNGRATGLLWTLRGLRVHRSAHGRRAADGRLRPDGYRDAWQGWDDGGETVVRYHPAAGLPAPVPRAVKNGRPVRRMPDAARAGALDPLSALQTVRQRVAEAAAAGIPDPQQMVVPIYDGKLRYDARVELAPPQTVVVAGQPWRARVATVGLVPRAGFSDRHAAEWRGGGLRLTIMDHVKAIPLRLEVDQGWGAFALEYLGPCAAGAATCPAPLGDSPTPAAAGD
nr:DUF3108 domain-containing protein [Roseospira goensis]